MPSASDSSAAAAEVVGVLTDRWAVAGALAALEYRRVGRVTYDADFLVDWVDGLVEHLVAAGYEPS